ncbi:ribose ABC transporter ATP-binding protein RbsA [Virgibacillus siamensis]|uniref:Ribose ABC transporter ATP-binding protein RbsA n=1 Tax=Virgibacillus siamensis TaxID=480071 RepID=A0ABP3QPM3_9BACI
MTDTTLMRMMNIKKSFNHVPVLKDVSFEVERGEIHALLGENGAGKSTLMNILGGVLQPDSGTIHVNGNVTVMSSPKVSQDHEISFIHQELNVVNDLTVYENMFLGSEIRTKLGFLDVTKMCRETEKILGRLGVDINPKGFVRELNTSYKQMIEISKSLLHNSKLIIMDEPTSALTEHEVERLFELMRNLKNAGVSIIYISHKLNEINEICDRYTVLRDGEVAGNGSMAHTNLEEITKLMVGNVVSEERLLTDNELGSTVLEVNNLTCDGFFKAINFSVRKGEIVGFTGLSGDGRTELFETLFGYRKKYTGEIKIDNKVVRLGHPKKAVAAGLGLVPKDRKENAIIKDLSVQHNLTVSAIRHFEKNGLINAKQEKSAFQFYKDKLNIKVPSPNITIDKLSGGNQQKVVIAKWLEVDTDIIIFDNPTQGIDIGAKREIYKHIVNLAEQGKGIIVLSSEAPELLKVCHVIHVMYQGEMTAKFAGDIATEDEIMTYATGSKKEGVEIG